MVRSCFFIRLVAMSYIWTLIVACQVEVVSSSDFEDENTKDLNNSETVPFQTSLLMTFTLVDTNTGTILVQNLHNEYIIDLIDKSVAPWDLTVEVIVDDRSSSNKVESVYFTVMKETSPFNEPFHHTENNLPFVLCGNKQTYYKPCPKSVFQDYGMYTVSATPYGEKFRGGEPGDTCQVLFLILGPEDRTVVTATTAPTETKESISKEPSDIITWIPKSSSNPNRSKYPTTQQPSIYSYPPSSITSPAQTLNPLGGSFVPSNTLIPSHTIEPTLFVNLTTCPFPKVSLFL